MRLREIVNDVACGMARTRSGLMVLAGLTAVLSGVERMMIVSLQTRANGSLVAFAKSVPVVVARQRKDYFTIRQTRSEFGYVYWVLQGHGYFQSFSLHDTWDQAMAEADARLMSARMLAQERRELAHA